MWKLALPVALAFALSSVGLSSPLSAAPTDRFLDGLQNADSSSQSSEFQAGLAALQARDLDVALEHFTLAEQSAPADARVHNFRAIALQALNRNEEATSEFENAIRLDPKLGDAYRGLGFLEWTEHRLSQAAEHLERALSLAPHDSFAHYYLGRVLLDEGNGSRALAELEVSQELWPSDATFLIQIGSAYLSAGRQSNAQKSLERAANSFLTPAQTARVSSLLVAAEDAPGATVLMDKFCAQQRPNPPDWASIDLALAYLMAGNYEMASKTSQTFLESRTDTSEADAAGAWTIIGIALARRGENNEALQAMNEAVTLSPKREEPWLNLTLELMSLERLGDSIDTAQKGLAAVPDSYALHLRFGAANLAAGHYDEAEAEFRRLAEAGDPLPLSYVGLAQVLLRTGRADQAASMLLGARHKLGDSFLLIYFSGLALDRAGKAAEAFQAYKQAVAQNPKSVEARVGLAKTELTLNRTRDAIEELKDVLRLEPTNAQAARLLSRAYRRAGDAASAAKYASNAGAEPEPQPDRTLLGDFIPPDWMIPADEAVNQ